MLTERTEPARTPRILFFGLRCDFSVAPLNALLDAGLDVGAVVVPAEGAPPGAMPVRRLPGSSKAGAGLPLLTSSRTRTIVDVARDRGVPVLAASRLNDPRAVAALAAERPDLICVACFPKRLPPAILALPPLGCLNVHPSLLPANRGPVPLFWTFRLGEGRTGVTIHLMEEALDAGDIVAQAAVDVPDGIAGRELDLQLAAVGSRLLVAAVRAVAAGTAQRTHQAPKRSSYHPWPAPADFVVGPSWSARHAFNFIRGAANWGIPMVDVAGRRLPIAAAVAYHPDRLLGAPIVAAGEHAWIQCSPGVVQVKLADE